MCTISDTTGCQGNTSLFSGHTTFEVQGSVTYVFVSTKIGCELYVSENFDTHTYVHTVLTLRSYVSNSWLEDFSLSLRGVDVTPDWLTDGYSLDLAPFRGLAGVYDFQPYCC